MTNVLLDCGFHYGEGLRRLSQYYEINDDWRVYAFEPNPACELADRAKTFRFRVRARPMAVWIYDGYIAFQQEDHTKSDSHSPEDGWTNLDGWGSCLAELNSNHRGLGEPISVPCFDFSHFLRVNFQYGDYRIICKFDIEGAEFPVLRKMLVEDTVGLLDTLYVEYHARLIPSESEASEQALTEALRQRTNVLAW